MINYTTSGRMQAPAPEDIPAPPQFPDGPIHQFPMVPFGEIEPNKHYYVQYQDYSLGEGEQGDTYDMIVYTYSVPGLDWKTDEYLRIVSTHSRTQKRIFDVDLLTENGVVVPQEHQEHNGQAVSQPEYIGYVGVSPVTNRAWRKLQKTNAYTNWVSMFHYGAPIERNLIKGEEMEDNEENDSFEGKYIFHILPIVGGRRSFTRRSGRKRLSKRKRTLRVKRRRS